MLKDQHFVNIISTGISTGLNHPKTTVKGINKCHECESGNIIHDFKHDMIYCGDCGLVLRQGVNDYTPLEFSSFPIMSRENKILKAKLLNNKD